MISYINHLLFYILYHILVYHIIYDILHNYILNSSIKSLPTAIKTPGHHQAWVPLLQRAKYPTHTLV